MMIATARSSNKLRHAPNFRNTRSRTGTSSGLQRMDNAAQRLAEQAGKEKENMEKRLQSKQKT